MTVLNLKLSVCIRSKILNLWNQAAPLTLAVLQIHDGDLIPVSAQSRQWQSSNSICKTNMKFRWQAISYQTLASTSLYTLSKSYCKK